MRSRCGLPEAGSDTLGLPEAGSDTLGLPEAGSDLLWGCLRRAAILWGCLRPAAARLEGEGEGARVRGLPEAGSWLHSALAA